jgi:hypothetical protein
MGIQRIGFAESMRILLIGDLHCGSRFSPWPAEYQLAGDNQWICSPAQVLLNLFWARMLKDAKRRKPDVIILNGDMIEGGCMKGVDVVSIRTDDQLGGALMMLQPLVTLASRAIYMIRGTGYHVGRAGENEATLAMLLKVEYLPELYLNTPAGVVNVLHHIGITTRPALDQNALGNALADKQLELLRNYGRDMPNVTCIVRSHRHRAVTVQLPNGNTAMALGPYQLKTDYGFKVAPNTEPQISYTWLDATSKGYNVDTVRLQLPAPTVREIL